MVSKADKRFNDAAETDSRLIKDYIKNKSKEHCGIIGPDCERCSVTSFCEHRKERA